jgi:hypothetical protein
MLQLQNFTYNWLVCFAKLIVNCQKIYNARIFSEQRNAYITVSVLNHFDKKCVSTVFTKQNVTIIQ